MSQPSLFERSLPFLGATFSPAHDETRLRGLMARVKELMLDGTPRTLREIAEATGGAEASVSARLRDLRRMGFTVTRRARGARTRGVFEYAVTR